MRPTRAIVLTCLLALSSCEDDAPDGVSDASQDVATQDAVADVAQDGTTPADTLSDSVDASVEVDAADDADATQPGDTSMDAVADSGGDTSDGADTSADTINDSTSDDAGGDATDASAACGTAIATLAAELHDKPGACSVVVRLDHDSLATLGYQVICGGYRATSEAEARATAQRDTGYGAAGASLHGSEPDDFYVFYESPGDFGGAAAVSVTTGTSVFGGSIVWDGAGDITWPTSWRDSEGLDSGCPVSGGIGKRVGYDLVGGTALSAIETDAAVAVAADTAIPGAFWQGGYVFGAVVLRYPRSVGVFDPTTAEWIVIVHGGVLE